jgi:hypothetical protein
MTIAATYSCSRKIPCLAQNSQAKLDQERLRDQITAAAAALRDTEEEARKKEAADAHTIRRLLEKGETAADAKSKLEERCVA